MPTIDVPFGEVDKPIEPGMYLAEIVSSQIKTVKNQESKYYGSSMIEWTFAIIDPNYPDMKGRKLMYNSNLSDKVVNDDGTPDKEAQRKALFYLREFLKTVGAEFTDNGFDTESALHCKAIIKVVNNTYKGRPVSNIEQVMPAQQVAA